MDKILIQAVKATHTNCRERVFINKTARTRIELNEGGYWEVLLMTADEKGRLRVVESINYTSQDQSQRVAYGAATKDLLEFGPELSVNRAVKLTTDAYLR